MCAQLVVSLDRSMSFWVPFQSCPKRSHVTSLLLAQVGIAFRFCSQEGARGGMTPWQTTVSGMNIVLKFKRWMELLKHVEKQPWTTVDFCVFFAARLIYWMYLTVLLRCQLIWQVYRYPTLKSNARKALKLWPRLCQGQENNPIPYLNLIWRFGDWTALCFEWLNMSFGIWISEIKLA